ncbi:hypothetical protein JXE04_00505 [Patescibacteria group bacterium]|nr:hypothetical protein [Patescibacteria group bacterium]
MKIKLKPIQLNGVIPAQWLRRAGYTYIVDHKSGQESFVRRFNRDLYPRFHLYVQVEEAQDIIFFNLHLDHKKASYEGQSRHSADYDGELVQAEAARLQSLLGLIPAHDSNIAANRSVNNSIKPGRSEREGDVLNRLQAPDLNNRVVQVPKKSWWQKIF